MSDYSSSNSLRPKVTVVIPVFNDQSNLLACLAGLEKQLYPLDRLEIVVVDNGSTPPLGTIEGNLLTINTVRCETPGSYAARNAGVRVATGEILAFTDADCVPDHEWIERGIAALKDSNQKSIIGGEVLFMNPSVRTGTALYQQAVGFEQKGNIDRRGFTVTANMFCTTAQFHVIGPFEERLLSGGDLEWCWRAAKHGVAVRFEPKATVYTLPRIRLRDAIRQARRVTAGRVTLNNYACPPAAAKHRRTIAQSVAWIVSRSQLSPWERAKVLATGAVIRLAAIIEQLRLRLGGTAERR